MACLYAIRHGLIGDFRVPEDGAFAPFAPAGFVAWYYPLREGAMRHDFSPILLTCLSHMSYLIGDETSGRAVVVDPRRDVADYLVTPSGRTANRLGHRNPLSRRLSAGHLELAATGAVISYGEGASLTSRSTSFPTASVSTLARCIRDPATPGHTPESISIVVYEQGGDEPYGVLTGDTLLIGDVGRPDLLAAAGLSRADLAGQLFRSLHGKLLTLPDETRVFPAHGAGSACGRAISTETVSTIGEQRRANYALALPTKRLRRRGDRGQSPAPPYFSFDAQRNRQQRTLLDERIAPADRFRRARRRRVRTVRGGARYPCGPRVSRPRTSARVDQHRPRGTVRGVRGHRAAPDSGSSCWLHAGGRELEAQGPSLARIGFDNVVGYLVDHPAAFSAEHPDRGLTSSTAHRGSAHAAPQRDVADLLLLDVRNPGELATARSPDAIHLPLPCLMRRADELDRAPVRRCTAPADTGR